MTEPAFVDVTVAVVTPEEFVVHGPELNVPVPDEIVKNTLWPPTTFPLTSFAVTVIVDAVEPSAVTDDGEDPTVDCAAVAAPAVNVTDADSEMRVPEALVPRYPRTTTTPDVVDVSVAVATPEEFVDQGPELSVPVPEETAKNTSWFATTLPWTSFAVTVIVDAVEPSAVTDAGDGTTVD